MLLKPLLLRVRKGSARYADRIKLVAQRIDVIRLINRKLRLRDIKLAEQIRSVPAHTEIVLGCSERAEQFRMISSVCAVALCSKNVHFLIVKRLEKGFVIAVLHHLSVDGMLF